MATHAYIIAHENAVIEHTSRLHSINAALDIEVKSNVDTWRGTAGRVSSTNKDLWETLYVNLLLEQKILESLLANLQANI